MFRLSERDIHGGIDFISLSLISQNTKVLIIGGGKAGYIKAGSFIERGAVVTLISNEIDQAFDKFSGSNLFISKRKRYAWGEMDCFHIVVIAVDDQEAAEEIRNECRDKYKVFIDCTNFKEGNASIPSSRSTGSMNLSLQTRGGSPITSRFMADLMKEKLEIYDDYVKFSTSLRYTFKGNPLKMDIMDFISSEDFLFMFERGMGKTILKTFYGGIDFET